MRTRRPSPITLAASDPRFSGSFTFDEGGVAQVLPDLP
jgi:hypothetical protein